MGLKINGAVIDFRRRLRYNKSVITKSYGGGTEGCRTIDMSNMENFKTIIAEERKRTGMTQEAFASRLGITPQAVSKWENGVGYPDVTLFPAIAEVLNVPIQRLFGETEDKTPNDAVLPPNYNGLPLVFSNGRRVCYSDKKVKEVNEDTGRCLFRDGSEADVAAGKVINRGRGEIRIYEVKDVTPDYPLAPPPTDTSFSQDEAPFDNLELSLSMACDARVVYEPAGSRVVAEGDPEFIAALRVERRDGGLFVGLRPDDRYNGRGGKNKLTIFTDRQQGSHAKISISGAGDCTLPLRFESLSLSIAGSGDINASDCGKADVRIAGSGDVNIKSVDRDVKVSIAGSGDVTMDNVGGKLEASIAGSGELTAQSAATADIGISGSGDIVIKHVHESLAASIHGSGDITCGGHVRTLKLNISGGGNFDGRNLTVDTADLSASGTADITIGAITGSSIEKLSKSCNLRVAKRGEA